MQPNLQPPRLMLHSSMSAGRKEEAVGEGQWDPPALTLNHCVSGFWIDKPMPSWDRGSAPQGVSSSAISLQLCQLHGDKGHPDSWCPQRQGWVQAEPSPDPLGCSKQSQHGST